MGVSPAITFCIGALSRWEVYLRGLKGGGGGGVVVNDGSRNLYQTSKGSWYTIPGRKFGVFSRIDEISFAKGHLHGTYDISERDQHGRVKGARILNTFSWLKGRKWVEIVRASAIPGKTCRRGKLPLRAFCLFGQRVIRVGTVWAGYVLNGVTQKYRSSSAQKENRKKKTENKTGETGEEDRHRKCNSTPLNIKTCTQNKREMAAYIIPCVNEFPSLTNFSKWTRWEFNVPWREREREREWRRNVCARTREVQRWNEYTSRTHEVGRVLWAYSPIASPKIGGRLAYLQSVTRLGIERERERDGWGGVNRQTKMTLDKGSVHVFLQQGFIGYIGRRWVVGSCPCKTRQKDNKHKNDKKTTTREQRTQQQTADHRYLQLQQWAYQRGSLWTDWMVTNSRCQNDPKVGKQMYDRTQYLFVLCRPSSASLWFEIAGMWAGQHQNNKQKFKTLGFDSSQSLLLEIQKEEEEEDARRDLATNVTDNGDALTNNNAY